MSKSFDLVQLIDRDAWKARPANHYLLAPMGVARRLTLHHTGEAVHEEGDGLAWVRSIQAYHMSERKDAKGVTVKAWGDIGYHFVILRDGRVARGREMRWRGAHAGNPQANAQNIGIALLGDVHLSAEQRDSLFSFVRWLFSLYGPLDIHLHSDFVDTACPGPTVKRWAKALREDLGLNSAQTQKG